MKRVLGGTTLRNINVQVGDARELPAAQQQIIALLRQRHNIRAGKDDDFTVRGQQEIADMATAQSKTMTRLLGAIAGVSLIVFFFQAEDGIRDYKVTGVQTCALPICRWFFLTAHRTKFLVVKGEKISCLPPLYDIYFEYADFHIFFIYSFFSCLFRINFFKIGRASCRERV